jgi:hypothetical protein
MFGSISHTSKGGVAIYGLLRLQLPPLQSWYHIRSATPNQVLTFPIVAEMGSCAGTPTEMATEGAYCNATFWWCFRVATSFSSATWLLRVWLLNYLVERESCRTSNAA